MAELTVIDTNDRAVHRCADFEVGEYGITTMDENDERTGFFQFGHFAYVVADRQRAKKQSGNQRG
jgi:hypothetical protein